MSENKLPSGFERGDLFTPQQPVKSIDVDGFFYDAPKIRRMEASLARCYEMLEELKALDLGDSETRIRIYHVLNKYNML